MTQQRKSYFSLHLLLQNLVFRSVCTIFAFDMKHLLTIFVLLLALTCCTTEVDRNRMRAGLDSINVRNRNGQSFTVAEVQPYVGFFDENGTPNDRLLAHYLLGLAYSDHGEAPMALQCFQDAADCADTTVADCDYAQLARVYGQMAQVFYSQGLYRQQLDYEQLSVKYAWKGRDTLLAIRNYEQEFLAYKGLGIMDSAVMVIEQVAKEYMSLGYLSDAAISLGGIVKPLIDMGDYKKAKYNIDMYESKSGRFDSCGNIEAGREIYYKSKGLYFLHTNRLDSAEYYFRKELRDGKDYGNQNSAANGLAQLFHKKQRPDSAAKYAIYAYTMLDSVYAQRTTKEVERMQAMYDYTRHQEVARKESERAALANRKLLICFIVLLAVLLLSSWLYIARKKVIESLHETAVKLDDLKRENYKLNRDASASKQQISENEERIKQLEKKLGRYSKLIYFGIETTESNLKSSPNYLKIKEMAYKGQKLSNDDWDIICNLICEYLPASYDFIISQFNINSSDYRICILLRLHFKVGEIANMLGVSSPYISKVSTDILEKTFGKKGSSKELYKELCKNS